MQSQIQRIIYASHGEELSEAKKALKDAPNPKTRMKLLSSVQYSGSDPIVSSVFNYSQSLFLEIYELRNILAHEHWISSDEYKDAVLFAKLDEEARLMTASGRLYHKDDTTPQEIYDATIRYIRSLKVVSSTHLQNALKDAELCSWALMQISMVIDEQDPIKKEEVRKAFLVFKGTSHLFDESKRISKTVRTQSSKQKKIQD